MDRGATNSPEQPSSNDPLPVLCSFCLRNAGQKLKAAPSAQRVSLPATFCISDELRISKLLRHFFDRSAHDQQTLILLYIRIAARVESKREASGIRHHHEALGVQLTAAGHVLLDCRSAGSQIGQSAPNDSIICALRRRLIDYEHRAMQDGKDHRQECNGALPDNLSTLLNHRQTNVYLGMYSQQAWGGPVDPFILIKFTDVGKDQGDDPIVSLVIFEWKDEDFIGVPTSPGSYEKYYQCEPNSVEAGLCNSTDIGEFILSPNATAKSNSVILTKAMHLKESVPIKYPITKTGYYCVLTFGYSTDEFEALVEFRNAYGELPAAQIPKLPFYGGITLLYALVSVFWGFLYFQHRADICE